MSVANPTSNPVPSEPVLTFDNCLDKVHGKSYRWQIFITFILSISLLFGALQSYIFAVINLTPGYHCKIPDSKNLDFNNATLKETLQSIAFPRDETGSFSKCNIYDRNYSEIFSSTTNLSKAAQNTTDLKKIKCSEWMYDTDNLHGSLVTEFDLVCDREVLLITVPAILTLGAFIGSSFYGFIADRWGRRISLISGVIQMLVTAIVIAFSVNYIMYIILGFFVGMATGVYYSVAFTIITEFSTDEFRHISGILSQVFYMLGYFVIAGLNYAITRWDYLQLTISVPAAILLLYFWILPESPRWLLSKSRTEETVTIMTKIARFNKTIISELDIKNLITEYFKKGMEAEKEPEGDAKRIFLDLFRTPEMRKRILIIYFQWFVNNFVIYGVVFNATNLSSDERLINLLLAASQVVAVPVSSIALKFLGRKPATYISFILGGIFYGIVLAIPQASFPGREIVLFFGQFFSTCTFVIITIYAIELMPDTNRSIAIGTAGSVGIAGIFVTNYVSQLMNLYLETGPLILYAVINVVGGILTCLLPEIRGTTLPKTIQDVENYRGSSKVDNKNTVEETKC